jgi:CspA family cold shock protein
MQRINGMQAGKVKWFNNTKGFGFIVADDNENQDVFAHYSSIESYGYRTLRAGQEVGFELLDSPKGPQALNIVLKNSVGELKATPLVKIVLGK